MADHGDNASPATEAQAQPEHLNIKVTDNNNEVFFKIKKNTKLEKLMTAFCERQGKALSSVRFLFEGQRVQPTDTPDSVSFSPLPSSASLSLPRFLLYWGRGGKGPVRSHCCLSVQPIGELL